MAGGRIALFFLSMSGMIAWAAQFAAIYGVTATLCERGWADAALFGIGVVPLAVLATTVAALAATGFVLWLALGRKKRMGGEASAADRFLNETTIVLSGLSLVSILWQGLPGALLPPCY